MKRWRKIILRTLIALVILTFIGVWILLPKFILSPYRMQVEHHPELFASGKVPEDFGLEKIDFDFQTTQGDTIDAWFIPAKGDSALCNLIVLHGIGACKELFLPAAQHFTSHQCNVVLFDLRAHGQSGGAYCTYGFYEKDDVRKITDKLEVLNGLPTGVYGTSLGGAMAYQSMEANDRLDFGVIESTFDEMQSVVREYTQRFLGFRCNWLADFALWRAEHVADFDADQVKPCLSASHINKPMLVIHGTADIHIPFEFGKRNFDALASAQKIFVPVEGADHNNVGIKGGPALMEQKIQFILQSARQTIR